MSQIDCHSNVKLSYRIKKITEFSEEKGNQFKHSTKFDI